jgi:non-specific serine/threonine protein kinase/serine/threonine-protein kinase
MSDAARVDADAPQQHGEHPKAPSPGPYAPTRSVGDTAPAPASRSDVADVAIPDRVGPYRVIGPLAEGGMGIVLQAWQEEPVRRVVAIKLIKLGMDTRAVVERFRMEQQALALMNHPNVARVFEAGTTDAGRPYFVMEYVPGEPIVSYCNAYRLDIPQRLRLFQQACDAVQHAHQKGIVHRDLKSSNILVMLQDDKPFVKVIDFGVSRAAGADRMVTEVGQFVGTPGYMSPEQACNGGVDVDTRSDVYSLGVVLYELLAGVQPFDPALFRDAGYAEICRLIREVDPPPPSRRLSRDRGGTLPTATYADMDRKDLVRRLKGDLDCIVMKALEKDRARRYPSASGLSADIGRYLRSEPVTAGRPSTWYRCKRFVRRHPTGVAMAVGVAVMLLATSALTTVAALRARAAERALEVAHAKAVAERNESERLRAEAERQKVEAQQARAAAEEVNRFLNDMITAVRPGRGGPEVTVREALDNASRTITGRFRDQPLVEASLRHSIGRAYSALQRPLEAVVHLREGLAIRQRILGPNHADTLWIENNLVNCVTRLGRTSEAEHMLTNVLDRRRRDLGARHAETLVTEGQLAGLYEQTGQWAKAEPLLAHLIEETVPSTGPSTRPADPSDAARYAARYGICMTELGRYAQAEPVLERAHEMLKSLKRRDAQREAEVLAALVECCRATGRPDVASDWEARLATARETTRPTTTTGSAN